MAKSSRSRVGLMGGTFDPIHNGHLLAADEACHELSLERVVFLPTGTPPHKQRENMASAEDRYAMVLLATGDNPCFEVSRIETERNGNSYTKDTLIELSALNPDTDFYLILGLDSILDIPNWRDPLEICRLCTLVAASRPGYDEAKLAELPSPIAEKVYILDASMLDISASDIRDRVSRGASIRYRVPHLVETYIKKHRIYGTSDGEEF